MAPLGLGCSVPLQYDYLINEDGSLVPHLIEPKCKHDIDQSRCLSPECYTPTNIPIRGEASWDSALQQPDGGLFLNRFQSFYPPIFNVGTSISFRPLSLSSFLTESPKKSQRKPKATKRSMPVIGYRGWKVATRQHRDKQGQFLKGGELALQSLNSEFGFWGPGTTRARCKMRKHKAPDYFCECGLYVLSGLADAPKWYGHNGIPDDVVIGAVIGWGEVIQHGSEGWRAEFAQPIAFLKTDVFGDQPLLYKVAEQYNLPIYERRGLELYAKEYGEAFG